MNRYALSLQDAFTLPPEVISDYLMKSASELNLDLIWTAADCSNIVLKALGAKTTFDLVGGAATVDKPLIEEIDEIHQLDLTKIENSPDIQNLLRVTELIKEQSNGNYAIGISQWGPFTLAGQMIGIENLMRLSITDKKGIKKLLDFSETIILRYLKLFQSHGADLICLAEPTASGDMISARMFESIVLPHLKKCYQQVEAGAKMLHICGNTSKIIHLIPESGTDLFSFDYKVDVSVVAKALSGKIAFAGQLNPVSVMLEGSEEDVYKAAIECIHEAGNAEGYILMPGCDLPPKTKAENVLSMVKAAHNTEKE